MANDIDVLLRSYFIQHSTDLFEKLLTVVFGGIVRPPRVLSRYEDAEHGISREVTRAGFLDSGKLLCGKLQVFETPHTNGWGSEL
mmetsp:Transcript_15289/g.23925  ORF Transcript_15289/g.23925 Transcript_15289/m.23925 type:complete len:85 (-) Transcript_15289:19-273(-)